MAWLSPALASCCSRLSSLSAASKEISDARVIVSLYSFKAFRINGHTPAINGTKTKEKYDALVRICRLPTIRTPIHERLDNKTVNAWINKSEVLALMAIPGTADSIALSSTVSEKRESRLANFLLASLRSYLSGKCYLTNFLNFTRFGSSASAPRRRFLSSS